MTKNSISLDFTVTEEFGPNIHVEVELVGQGLRRNLNGDKVIHELLMYNVD